MGGGGGGVKGDRINECQYRTILGMGGGKGGAGEMVGRVLTG